LEKHLAAPVRPVPIVRQRPHSALQWLSL